MSCFNPHLKAVSAEEATRFAGGLRERHAPIDRLRRSAVTQRHRPHTFSCAIKKNDRPSLCPDKNKISPPPQRPLACLVSLSWITHFGSTHLKPPFYRARSAAYRSGAGQNHQGNRCPPPP